MTSADYLPPGDVINTQSRFPQQTCPGPMRTSDSRVGSRKESEGMPSKQRSLSSAFTGYDTRLLKCATTKEKASGDKLNRVQCFYGNAEENGSTCENNLVMPITDPLNYKTKPQSLSSAMYGLQKLQNIREAQKSSQYSPFCTDPEGANLYYSPTETESTCEHNLELVMSRSDDIYEAISSSNSTTRMWELSTRPHEKRGPSVENCYVDTVQLNAGSDKLLPPRRHPSFKGIPKAVE